MTQLGKTGPLMKWFSRVVSQEQAQLACQEKAGELVRAPPWHIDEQGQWRGKVCSWSTDMRNRGYEIAGVLAYSLASIHGYGQMRMVDQ